MNIDDDAFLVYAAKYYDNASCMDVEEFYDDLKRFKYLRRLFGKYEDCGELRERLILNHIIILYNVFGPAATALLFFRLKDYLPYLKSFLILIDRLPERVVSLDGTIHITSDIPQDRRIDSVLRNI